MKTIRVHRNPDCPKCARYARWHLRLDWLDRVETSTATPQGHAPLRIGEVIVEDRRDFTLHESAAAFALLAHAVPACWPLLALLPIASVRRAVEREMRGACDQSCGLPS
jgi:hypothetical protein